MSICRFANYREGKREANHFVKLFVFKYFDVSISNFKVVNLERLFCEIFYSEKIIRDVCKFHKSDSCKLLRSDELKWSVAKRKLYFFNRLIVDKVPQLPLLFLEIDLTFLWDQFEEFNRSIPNKSITKNHSHAKFAIKRK